MYDNYKVVVNTAAGRRRYMQYLVPFVISSDIVDRYDIWINTHNGADIEFFRKLSKAYSKINLVWQPDGIVDGISSINAFYKKCIEEQTVYCKLDDDIIWMEEDSIEKMVKFRIDNPEYFVVSPLIINNSLSTYLLQERGKIKLDKYYNPMCAHPILWKNGDFAVQLHQWFLNTQLTTGKYRDLHISKQPMGMTRFSINCILWFGDVMKEFNGIVPGDDEEFVSCIYPTRHGMMNCWNGDVVMAHFAFYTQREKLDKANILQQYGDYLAEIWSNDSNMRMIPQNVQSIMEHIAEKEKELRSIPSPYREKMKKKKGVLKRIYDKSPFLIKYIVRTVYLKLQPKPVYIK